MKQRIRVTAEQFVGMSGAKQDRVLEMMPDKEATELKYELEKMLKSPFDGPIFGRRRIRKNTK